MKRERKPLFFPALLQDLPISFFILASNSSLSALYFTRKTKGDAFMKNKMYNFFENILNFYADFFTRRYYHF